MFNRTVPVATLVILTAFPSHETHAQDLMTPEEKREERQVMESALSLAHHHLRVYEYFGGERDPQAVDQGRGRLDIASQYFDIVDAVRHAIDTASLAAGHYGRGLISLYRFQHTGDWKHEENAKRHFEIASRMGHIASKIELHRLPSKSGRAFEDRDHDYCREIGQLYSANVGELNPSERISVELAIIAEEYGRILLSPICAESPEIAFEALRLAARNGRTFANYLLYRTYKRSWELVNRPTLTLDFPADSEDFMNRLWKSPCNTGDAILENRDYAGHLKNAALGDDAYGAYGLYSLGEEYAHLSERCLGEAALLEKYNSDDPSLNDIAHVHALMFRRASKEFASRAVMPLLVAGHRSTFRFVPFCLPAGSGRWSCETYFLESKNNDPISQSARLLSGLVRSESNFWKERAEVDYSKRAYRRPTKLVSQGTGFYVSPSHVLTNEHVVDECAVVRVNGMKVAEGDLWYSDDDDLDLALMRVDEDGREAKRALWAMPCPGSEVHVYGYDHGRPVLLQGRLSRGIVGGWEFLPAGMSDLTGGNYVRHTAPSYPGNSGGPLIDGRGYIVGVATGVDRILDNYGLAISSRSAMDFLQSKWIMEFLNEEEELDIVRDLEMGYWRRSLGSCRDFYAKVFEGLREEDVESGETVDVVDDVVSVTCWE